jgi:hypothetical protein
MIKTARHLGFAAVILASALSFATQPAAAQAKDPIIGTWVLNFGKSDFKAIAPPQSKTLTFAAADNGFTEKSKVLNANGATDQWQYTVKYDGTEASMPPDSPLNTVSLKRVDANTFVRSGTMRKKIVETVTYKLSNGGKVLTVTTVGTDDSANDTVQVYDKQ